MSITSAFYLITGVALAIGGALVPILIDRALLPNETWVLTIGTAAAAVGALQVSQAIAGLNSMQRARALLEPEIGTNALLLNTIRRSLNSTISAADNASFRQHAILPALAVLRDNLDALDKGLRLIGRKKSKKELDRVDSEGIPPPNFAEAKAQVESVKETIRDIEIAEEELPSGVDLEALNKVRTQLNGILARLEAAEEEPTPGAPNPTVGSEAREFVECPVCQTKALVTMPRRSGWTQDVVCTSCSFNFLIHRRADCSVQTSEYGTASPTPSGSLDEYSEILRRQQFPLIDAEALGPSMRAFTDAFEQASSHKFGTWQEMESAVQVQLNKLPAAQRSDPKAIRKVAYKCGMFRFLPDRGGMSLHSNVKRDNVLLLVAINIFRRLRSESESPLELDRVASLCAASGEDKVRVRSTLEKLARQS